MSNKRKSFSSQLLDNLLNDNSISKKNMTILLFVVGLIAMIGIYIIYINAQILRNKEVEVELTPEYCTMVLEEFGYSLSEIEEMNEENLIELAKVVIDKTDSQIAGDNYKEELSYTESLSIRTKFYQYAMIGDYESIINEYNDLKIKYYLSMPYNKKLIRIYNDAYVLNSASSDKNNITQQISVLQNLNDERMFLSMILESSLEVRNDILKDRLSLTFGKDDTTLKINSVSSSTMGYISQKELYKEDVKMYNMLEYLHEGEYIAYKVNFSLDTDNFNAYMFKSFDDMRINIYGIYQQGEVSDYVTVAESEKILSDIYNYNNSLKEPNEYDFNGEISNDEISDDEISNDEVESEDGVVEEPNEDIIEDENFNNSDGSEDDYSFNLGI